MAPICEFAGQHISMPKNGKRPGSEKYSLILVERDRRARFACPPK
jgi:hypothetical protein